MHEDVKEYTQKSTKLRSEGRFDEAILAARKAISLNKDDANAWWQLALSQREKDGREASIPAMLKVTDLAPHFADGWYELGRAYHSVPKLEDAVDAYESALIADEDHIESMRLLAYALKGNNGEAATARRLTLLRTVFQKDTLDSEDTFALAYLLGEAQEHAEAAKVYEAYTRDNAGQAAFFNLALGYRKLDRDADALDALWTAHRNGYVDEGLNTVLGAVQKKLLALRVQVLTKPQPYLPREDWYQHYVNPFELLNVSPADIEDNPKALLKAKQALLREVELEDGKVDWMPGLVLDKSSVMARLVDLDNPDAWLAHQTVFENKALGEFLTKGHLGHFLIDDSGLSEAELPYLLDQDTLRIISPKFAAQFDKVLTTAAERRDLSAVEALLDGRRWVLPEHEETCFEGTKRLLARLREPLMKLLDEVEKRPVSKAEINAALSNGSLGGLLRFLPVEFYEAHSATGVALRGLSVAHYNRERDAEEAKAILAMGKVCAEKSPALAHQMADDEKTLNEFIAEEKSKEAHLTFGPKSLAITKTGVVYGEQKLATADIIGVRWGLVQASSAPPTIRHTIAFQNHRGPDIVVTWSSTKGLDEQRQLWGSLVDAAVAYIIDSVAAAFQRQLDAHEVTRVGGVEVRKDGVFLVAKGWFSDKTVLVPWKNLSSNISNGSVALHDKTNPKAQALLPMETTYNAILLHLLASRKD